MRILLTISLLLTLLHARGQSQPDEPSIKKIEVDTLVKKTKVSKTLSKKDTALNRVDSTHAIVDSGIDSLNKINNALNNKIDKVSPYNIISNKLDSTKSSLLNKTTPNGINR